jgi:hypothetical protein
MTVLNSTHAQIEEKASPIDSVLEWLGEDLEKVDQEFRKNLKSGVPIISADAAPALSQIMRLPGTAPHFIGEPY